MIIAPKGILRFYNNIDIKPGGRERVFTSKSEQTAFFNSHVISALSRENYSYMRHTTPGFIKLNVEIDAASSVNNWQSLAGASWLSFENVGFEGITFYCIIDNFEYINNHTAMVKFSVDYFQSFMFSFDLNFCQVEREHLSTADAATLAADPWADVAEMYTAEPLPVSSSMEQNNRTVKVDNSPSAADIVEAGFNGKNVNSIDYDLHDWRCVLIAYQNENAQTETEAGGNGLFSTERLETVENDGMEGVFIGAPMQIPSALYKLNAYDYPQPLYIVIKEKSEDIQEVLDKYASNGITSSIIGVYFLPCCCYAPAYEEREGDHWWDKYGERLNVPLVFGLEGYDSPKLYRSPFSCIRVTTPSGTTKDYAIERFIKRNDVEGKEKTKAVHFSLVGNVIGTPTLSIIPCDYMYLSNSEELSHFNALERMVFSTFPQIPYVIDGYLTYMSSNYQSLLQSEGSTVAAERRALTNAEAGIGLAKNEIAMFSPGALAGAIAGNIGGKINEGHNFDYLFDNSVYKNAGDLAATLGGAADVALSRAQLRQGVREIQLEQDMINEERTRRKSGAAIQGDTYASEMFGGPEAYLPDLYSPPSGDINGIIVGLRYIRVTVTRLRSDILRAYNAFFKLYGYSSGRVKIPYIFNYIKQNGGELPEWHIEPLTNKNITYCKASNIDITGVVREAQEWIEGMFLNGCRFVK